MQIKPQYQVGYIRANQGQNPERISTLTSFYDRANNNIIYCEHFEERLWESRSFRHVMSEGQRKSLESPTGFEPDIFQVRGWLSFPRTFLRVTERPKPDS